MITSKDFEQYEMLAFIDHWWPDRVEESQGRRLSFVRWPRGWRGGRGGSSWREEAKHHGVSVAARG